MRLGSGGGPRDETVAALDQLIPWLAAQGYRFGFPVPPPLTGPSAEPWGSPAGDRDGSGRSASTTAPASPTSRTPGE